MAAPCRKKQASRPDVSRNRLTGGVPNSRYFPYTDEGAPAIIREYRERRFPLDVFMVDTDWREGGSYGYQVNTRRFPKFQAFLEQAHALGVRVGLNDHPKAMTQNALDPQEMEYRSSNLARFLYLGLDFWWFDRNWDVCLTGPLPVLCKEVWGMQVFRDMTHKAVPDRRPLIMANVDGIDDGIYLWPPDLASHRFPFQWTGDTLMGWDELRRGLANLLRVDQRPVRGRSTWNKAHPAQRLRRKPVTISFSFSATRARSSAVRATSVTVAASSVVEAAF